MLAVAMQWRGENEKGTLMNTEFYFTAIETSQNSEEVMMAQNHEDNKCHNCLNLNSSFLGDLSVLDVELFVLAALKHSAHLGRGAHSVELYGPEEVNGQLVEAPCSFRPFYRGAGPLLPPWGVFRPSIYHGPESREIGLFPAWCPGTNIRWTRLPRSSEAALAYPVNC